MSYNLFGVTRPDLNVPTPGSPILEEEWWNDPAHHDASGGRLNRWPPFVYRVLTPLLARGVAYVTGIDGAYYLVSFIALAAAAFFIGWSILELAGALIPAIGGAILFLVNPWAARFNLDHFMLSDPMAFFLASLAIWALVTRRRGLFFTACAIGVLNKESMVPMLLVYPLSELLLDRRVRWTSIATAIGVCAAWIVFRVMMPAAQTGYSMLDEFQPGFHHMKLILAAGVLTFGVIVPAILRRPWRSMLMVSLVPFVLGAVLAAWFVGDLGRAMVQALPAFSVAILWKWPADRRQQTLTLLVVPLAAAAAIVRNTHLSHFFALVVLLSLIAVAIEVWLARVQAIPSSDVGVMPVAKAAGQVT